MIKKLLDRFFPRKYVLINVRRGGYVGEKYNLVPYKRTLTKSQNKKHLPVFYPWKHFPRAWLREFEKPVSYMDTQDHQFEKRMMANTYRFKWLAIRKAKQLVKVSDILIIGIGEIVEQGYLGYATLLPYYKTRVIDLVKWSAHKNYCDYSVYSVVTEPPFDSLHSSHSNIFGRPRCVPTKNYWISEVEAKKHIDVLDPEYGRYYLSVTFHNT